MINHRKVVNQLQSLIPCENDIRFWIVEYCEHYSNGKTTRIIYLSNTGNGNKYRLYHSDLNDNVSNDDELFECCMDELKNSYHDSKYVMSSMIDNGYVMMCEMVIS